jgi:lipoprotein NlpD
MTITCSQPLRSAPRSAHSAALATLLLALLVGCASPQRKAPVEDRGARTPSAPVAAPVSTPTPTPMPAPAEASKPLLGVENAGKPGYYTVKPGDTLMRVGLESGQNWRDVARWNGIENPNLLEVGQVLRVVPPGADAAATTARAIPPTRVETRPLEGAPAATPPAVAAAVPSSPSSVAASAPAAAPATTSPDDDVAWACPASSNVATPFDEARSKGLIFTGKAGDPVFAAGDGRVIYVGSGVRGYGNLVIVKHNNTYLTAYAHNQSLLVKEDQVVRRGQKIAEMGSSDAERVQLHFEIRRLGKPVDPARLLPPR